MSTTTNLFHSDHVAGGWTEHDTVARRICTALWHATGTFKRIENYESDVVIDYTIVLRHVEEMQPACEVHLAYVVGVNGTHLHEVDYCKVDPFEDILADDRGGNTGWFKVAIGRHPELVDSVTGAKYGADRYFMTIEELTR